MSLEEFKEKKPLTLRKHSSARFRKASILARASAAGVGGSAAFSHSFSTQHSSILSYRSQSFADGPEGQNLKSHSAPSSPLFSPLVGTWADDADREFPELPDDPAFGEQVEEEGEDMTSPYHERKVHFPKASPQSSQASPVTSQALCSPQTTSTTGATTHSPYTIPSASATSETSKFYSVSESSRPTVSAPPKEPVFTNQHLPSARTGSPGIRPLPTNVTPPPILSQPPTHFTPNTATQSSQNPADHRHQPTSSSSSSASASSSQSHPPGLSLEYQQMLIHQQQQLVLEQLRVHLQQQQQLIQLQIQQQQLQQQLSGQPTPGQPPRKPESPLQPPLSLFPQQHGLAPSPGGPPGAAPSSQPSNPLQTQQQQLMQQLALLQQLQQMQTHLPPGPGQATSQQPLPPSHQHQPQQMLSNLTSNAGHLSVPLNPSQQQQQQQPRGAHSPMHPQPQPPHFGLAPPPPLPTSGQTSPYKMQPPPQPPLSSSSLYPPVGNLPPRPQGSPNSTPMDMKAGGPPPGMYPPALSSLLPPNLPPELMAAFATAFPQSNMPPPPPPPPGFPVSPNLPNQTTTAPPMPSFGMGNQYAPPGARGGPLPPAEHERSPYGLSPSLQHTAPPPNHSLDRMMAEMSLNSGGAGGRAPGGLPSSQSSDFGGPNSAGGGSASTSASRPTRRFAYGYGSSSGRQFMQECEAQLTELAIRHLETQEINPYRGSVPVERLQNVVRARYPDLYNTVVGSRHNSWRRFIERHTDVFHLFSVEDGKWRMRLLTHTDWEAGDRAEQAARAEREYHLIECLITFLDTRPGLCCKVDEFMDAYPTLPQNQNLPELVPLPARGDLVRFARRHPLYFIYDPATLSIYLNP